MTIKYRMLFFSISSLLASFTLSLGFIPLMGNDSAKAQRKARFSCENIQGIPTTVVNTAEGKQKRFIYWDSTYFVPSGYTPDKRCKQVTGRLNQFFSEKSTQYINSGHKLLRS